LNANNELITLRRITRSNYREIINLKVKPHQIYLIASNAVSMADAYFYKEAWMRAVYWGDKPVGFVMLADNSLKFKFIKHFKPNLYIWRFMIADKYQNQGFGRKTMELIIQHVKSKFNAEELITYTLPQNEDALEFYRKLGFKPTGRKLAVGDLELKLKLI
jgi:diamine N-acetyltransferase